MNLKKINSNNSISNSLVPCKLAKGQLILISSICIICFSLVGFVSSSPAVTVDRIVAVVNGEIITLSEVQELEQSLRAQGGEAVGKNETELRKMLLDKLIDNKLQLQMATKKSITVSEAQLKEALNDIKRQNGLTTNAQFEKALAVQGITLENFTKQLEENIKITILTRREVFNTIEITEEEVMKYYQDHKQAFEHLDQLRALHILFYLPAEATSAQIDKKKEIAYQVLEKLRGGEDFAKLAKEHSDDPSAEKGGDLGYFHKGEMLPVLENAANSLDPGGISPVLQTNLGFHIIKLTERQSYTPENNPKLKKEVEEVIYQEKSNEALKKWLNKLRKESKIKTML